MPAAVDLSSLKQAGFNDDDIAAWSTKKQQDLSNAGFSNKEIDDYFGTPPNPAEVNVSGMKKIFKQNLAEAKSPYEGSDSQKERNPDQHEASSYGEDFLSGWQGSSGGLALRGKMPDTVLPENAGFLARAAAMSGSFLGDLPAMAGGFIAGTPGGPVGEMVGAFTLPAATRAYLMEKYKNGDFQNFEDFRDRSSGILHEAIKGAATGVAVSLVGPLAGKAVGAGAEAVGGTAGKVLATPASKVVAMTASEAAAMTVTNAAMDGKVPKAQDFTDAALFMGLMHGVTAPFKSEAVRGKLMDVYSKTGLRPEEVAEMASKDPVLRQEVMSSDPAFPNSLKNAIDPKAETPPQIEINPNPELTKSTDGMGKPTEAEGVGKLMVEKLSDKDNPSLPEEPGEKVARSPEVNSVLSRVGEQADAPKEKLDYAKLYYKLIDKNDPLKNMTKALLGEEALGSKEDPYGLARSMRSVTRKGDEIIENGTRDFNTLKKNGTPGLTDIWEKASDLKEYRAYQIAKHSVDLEAQGIKTGVPLEDAEATVKQLGPKYASIAKQEVKFGNDNIDYLADSGVITKENASIMKDKYQNYVAMKRIMEPDEAQTGAGGKGITPYNPLKSIKGSERQIVDPLASRIKDTHQIIAMAERNRVAQSITKLIDKQLEKGDTSWGTKAKVPMSATELKSAETAQILKDQGFDPSTAKDLSQVQTVFRAAREPLADDQIASYKDGKRQVYENVPKGIVDAVRDMDAGTANLLVKSLSGPSKALRVGMLNSPAFAIRHFFRQEVMATSMSKGLHVPVLETVKGLTGLGGEDFGNWIMAGGGGDSIAAIDNNYIKSKLFDLNDETGMLDKAWNKTANGVQFIKHAIELTDEARTFQKYRNRLSSGEVKDPFQAQFQARDTGIDVQRSGAAMQAYAALDPFQNIRIQGLDLIARRLKEDPVSTTAKLMTTITIPSLILYAMNHDKNWYQQLTPQDRDSNWHFPVGDPDKDGHVIRLPKPFEPGIVFGALPERLMDAYRKDNPHAFDGFMKTVKDSVTPGYVPTFAQPILEQYSNKSYLTDSPLIDKHIENVLPEYQQKPYTSDVSKIIASGLRAVPYFKNTPGSLGSPAIIDNYIHDWTGGVGQLALSATDTALEKSGLADKMGVDYNKNPPESVWADNPFLRSFILRYPSTNTKSVGEFFDRYNAVQTRLNTIKNRQAAGDFVGYKEQVEAAAAEGQLVKMNGFKKTISDQMALIQKVTVLKDIDPHQKRQLIDQLATSVNAISMQSNKMMDEVEKDLPK